MVSWRSLGGLWGGRSAPGGRQDRSETVSGQLLERSWQLLGPSQGALSASWCRLGPSRRSPGAFGRLPGRLLEAILAVYFGGQDGRARKLIDFVVCDSLGGLVLSLFFASCSVLGKALGGQENAKITLNTYEKTLVFVGRKAFARFLRRARQVIKHRQSKYPT